jgi:hypothetical protein
VSKVKNPLFSVSEIPMATMTMMEQMTAVNLTATTGVDQMVAMTAMDQQHQLAPRIVMDPAETTTIPQVDAPAMAMADATATTALADAPVTTAPADASITTALADAPATTVPATTAPADAYITTALADAPATTAPADASITTALADAPATTAPADFPATIAPVDAPASIAPLVDALATLVPPIVGSGTGKKAGVMRPNPHSTTAR